MTYDIDELIATVEREEAEVNQIIRDAEELLKGNKRGEEE